MSEKTDKQIEAIVTYPQTCWSGESVEGISAVNDLEQGKILFFPNLTFPLNAQQTKLLTPTLVKPGVNNINYRLGNHLLTGVADPDKEFQVRKLLESYYQACSTLIAAVIPQYKNVLRKPVNSLRLHPIGANSQRESIRKDNRRLHIDTFAARPNHGERILRIFTNINPYGDARVWRIGEPFLPLATRYLPSLARYSPLKSWFLEKVGTTRNRRSHYDHLMLQLHNVMKADNDYQQQGQQIIHSFPAGSTWMFFSDQTPHAAMSGQFMLEQTFMLSVKNMQSPDASPLRTLQRITQQKLT